MYKILDDKGNILEVGIYEILLNNWLGELAFMNYKIVQC
jgi:hypothetical protein